MQLRDGDDDGTELGDIDIETRAEPATIGSRTSSNSLLRNERPTDLAHVGARRRCATCAGVLLFFAVAIVATVEVINMEEPAKKFPKQGVPRHHSGTAVNASRYVPTLPFGAKP